MSECLIPNRHRVSDLVSWCGLGPNKLCVGGMGPDQCSLDGPGSVGSQSRDFLLMLLARVSVGLGGRKMSAVICVVGIGVVAAMLFVAFNNTEPNRRLCLCPQAPHHLCERCGNRRKSDALVDRYTCPEVRLSYAQPRGTTQALEGSIRVPPIARRAISRPGPTRPRASRSLFDGQHPCAGPAPARCRRGR